ncbi:Protein-tyrosine sulfotransferase [Camellia lanceoleosa]|uniref:Protein-tyrosine sulfotransferase n=1 Tax=Camellia lanceoleosa TaxID=1840588 RepID=A0ACC0GEY9_9ERIC|nr:Protein-tyrosine sulfotransferase [Camellia lanceoleosa]
MLYWPAEVSPSFLDSKSDTSHYQNTSTDRKASKISSTENVEPTNENKLRTLPLPCQMTVGKLMDSYETCISSLRKTQAQRRNISLKRISPANFTKKARLQVPEVLLQEIQSLNSLDIKLYEYAGDIFSKQHEKMTEKFAGAEKLERTFNSSFGVPPSWNILCSVVEDVFGFLLGSF